MVHFCLIIKISNFIHMMILQTEIFSLVLFVKKIYNNYVRVYLVFHEECFLLVCDFIVCSSVFNKNNNPQNVLLVCFYTRQMNHDIPVEKQFQLTGIPLLKGCPESWVVNTIGLECVCVCVWFCMLQSNFQRALENAPLTTAPAFTKALSFCCRIHTKTHTLKKNHAPAHTHTHMITIDVT